LTRVDQLISWPELTWVDLSLTSWPDLSWFDLIWPLDLSWPVDQLIRWPELTWVDQLTWFDLIRPVNQLTWVGQLTWFDLSWPVDLIWPDWTSWTDRTRWPVDGEGDVNHALSPRSRYLKHHAMRHFSWRTIDIQ
jgi:hypothetical protein